MYGSVEGALKEVKRALLDADVNLKVTNRLVDGVKEKAVGMKLIDGKSRNGFLTQLYKNDEYFFFPSSFALHSVHTLVIHQLFFPRLNFLVFFLLFVKF